MKKIIPIFVPNQGCSHRCIFCHQPHITGVSLQTSLAPDDIRRTIDAALSEPKSQAKQARFEVAFYGGTFTGLDLSLQEQFLRTAQSYVDCGSLTGIRISTHPGMVTDRIFSLLASFSVTTVELGVQSFDDNVLQYSKRGHTAEDAEQTTTRLQRTGIAVGIHLMIGLPGDSSEGSIQSTHRVISLNPASVRIHPTLVIRHTPLADLYRAGQYVPLSLDTAVHTCKEMLKLFRSHQIPVIRIGLQPTASMADNIVAGPYHPAIRQLVESALMYDEMESLCARHQLSGAHVVFHVAPQDISTVRGQKNANLKKLREQFGLTGIGMLPDESVRRGEIRLEG